MYRTPPAPDQRLEGGARRAGPGTGRGRHSAGRASGIRASEIRASQSRPGTGRPGRVGPGLAAGRLALVLALGVTLAGASTGCLCPPRAEDLLATGYRTPGQTLTSFQTFLRADLPAQEYLCFSAGFRSRNQLSSTTYGEGRERLFAEQPWLKLFAKAEVVGERSVGEDEHWIDVRVLARTVRVKLVREGFYEIFARGEPLADDYADFDLLVAVRAQGAQSRVDARVPLEASAGQLAGLSEVVVARHWKIDAFFELGEQDEPLPSAASEPQP